jgi:hypothetical protein
MKQGISLQELAQQVNYVGQQKKDLIVPARGLVVNIAEDGISYAQDFTTSGSITEHAFNQLGTDLKIPAAYRRMLLEQGNYELLQENVNTLISQQDKNRMLRTIDGTLRGYLSDSFSTQYDNDTILTAVLPVLGDMGDDIVVKSCSLTDTKMYLKVISKKLQGDIKVGDPVNGGIAIVNSEVGMSFYSEQEFIERLVCTNGMTRANNISSFRKMHRGSRQRVGIVRQDTMRATQQAIALQIRDSIQNALSPDRFMKTVEDMRATTTRKIEGKVEEAVVELGKIVGYTQTEGESILKHLIEGGDLSQYGMLNAVTRFSQDEQVNYDRASELEVIGGKVLELSPKQWRNVSEAA